MSQKNNWTRVEPRARPLRIEETLSHQLEHIREVRNNLALAPPSRLAAWSEAIESLYDQLHIWHDDEFKLAWQNRPVAHVRGPDGRLYPLPVAADLRIAQRLLLDLMHKNRLLINHRIVSGPQKRPSGTHGDD